MEEGPDHRRTEDRRMLPTTNANGRTTQRTYACTVRRLSRRTAARSRNVSSHEG
jgi:hypothetical protein